MDIDKTKKKKKRKREKNDKEADEPLGSKSNDDQDCTTSQKETFTKDKKKKRRLNTSIDCESTNITVRKLNPEDSMLKNVKDSSKKLSKEERAIQRENRLKEIRFARKMQKIYSYVITWKRHRRVWKFEKIKQIWLMDNMMFPHCISDEMFPTVLEYFKECKGSARRILVEKALKFMERAEAETNEEHKQAILKSVTYNRARQVLQILPPLDSKKKTET